MYLENDGEDFIAIFLLGLVLVLSYFFGMIAGAMAVLCKISSFLFLCLLWDAANVVYYCQQVYGTCFRSSVSICDVFADDDILVSLLSKLNEITFGALHLIWLLGISILKVFHCQNLMIWSSYLILLSPFSLVQLDGSLGNFWKDFGSLEGASFWLGSITWEYFGMW